MPVSLQRAIDPSLTWADALEPGVRATPCVFSRRRVRPTARVQHEKRPSCRTQAAGREREARAHALFNCAMSRGHGMSGADAEQSAVGECCLYCRCRRRGSLSDGLLPLPKVARCCDPVGCFRSMADLCALRLSCFATTAISLRASGGRDVDGRNRVETVVAGDFLSTLAAGRHCVSARTAAEAALGSSGCDSAHAWQTKERAPTGRCGHVGHPVTQVTLPRASQRGF
jgi:hypothetical protein